MRRSALAALFAVCALLPVLLGSCTSSKPTYWVTGKQGLGEDPHGIKHRFRYVYYPNSFVYFESSQRAYYFIENGEWRVDLEPPRGVKIDVKEGVYIETSSNQPYKHFEEHRRKYPPGDPTKAAREIKPDRWKR
jgi:hypothetical protein